MIRLIGLFAVLTSTVALQACDANVGVGVSVGVPVGRYGYVGVGGSRWY